MDNVIIPPGVMYYHQDDDYYSYYYYTYYHYHYYYLKQSHNDHPSSLISSLRSHTVFIILAWFSSISLWRTGLFSLPGQAWVSLLLLAWSTIELVRYPFYLLSDHHCCPSPLTWLRYSAFMPLYPVGIIGEVALILLSLPEIKAWGNQPFYYWVSRGAVVTLYY